MREFKWQSVVIKGTFLGALFGGLFSWYVTNSWLFFLGMMFFLGVTVFVTYNSFYRPKMMLIELASDVKLPHQRGEQNGSRDEG